ncbi:hypothetical protein BS78_01G121600 [Paspalum vaginatum]|nr:hypothetical protein BS78_01G121600 [Paspalum vaginatum]
MSEHLALRSSVGSRSSTLPSHHQRLPPSPDPLSSVWIRRLHLTPSPAPPPPPLPRRAPPPSHQDGVSTDESRTPPPPPPRSAGFGPFRWSPRPLRDAPVGTWDAAAASAGGSAAGGGPPMLSPFFRLPGPLPQPPPPVTPIEDFEELAHVRPLIGLGSHIGSSGFRALSPPIVGGVHPHATWLAARAAGAAYPSHALDMVPIRTLNDLHDRQHGAIQVQPNLARHDPGSSSQHDEPFSYWNMGRFRRNTTTSSITPTSVSSANFGMKRNADSNNFLPLKLRKLSRAI